MSSSKEQQRHIFDRNSPRPPVPGEEKSHFLSDWGSSTIAQHPPCEDLDCGKFVKPASPPLPKRSCSFRNDSLTTGHTSDSTSASWSQQSFQQQPSSSGRPQTRHHSPPPPSCLKWAHSLQDLLQDGDGVKLFRHYLETEGKYHADALDFWFACEGLRKQDGPDKIQQLVKVIYKKFFVKSALPISEELRREIGINVKSSQCLEPPVTLFDDAQAQVERLIVNTTYPNFIKSDVYLQYLENAQTSSSSNDEQVNDFSNDLSSHANGPNPLPTLHEDKELIMHPPIHISHTSGSVSIGYHTPNLSGAPMRLTRDHLLLSQNRRAIDKTKSETFVSDGRSLVRTSRRQAAVNREAHMNQIVIPRTKRIDKLQCQPMDVDQFAAILFEKLEMVKKERETMELIEKLKLEESESLSSDLKKLLDDENDQSILDDHVSMVFPDTPVRSPGIASPKRNRHLQSSRRRKDGSIFSSDSGNVHDFADGGSEHKLGVVKSKSMPEYPDDRFARGAVGRRSSKKTLADLTDSGVSVVSDTCPASAPAKDSRVLAWIMQADPSGRGAGHTHSEMSMRHRSAHRTAGSATSPIAARHRKGFGSRSSSVERSSVGRTALGPAQPFVADPSMPPLPLPNTDIQLEETSRRLLMEVDNKGKLRQRTSNRHHPDLAQSGQSTLRKSQRGRQPADEVTTTVVFSFCDEQFPYRTKIPGSHVTLKQFKDYLPKKGNYRFFFKTVCEDLGNQVIQEEVSNDGDVLPLWEGKIMAQVKPVD
ncbi:axin-1 isoform X2 [Cylas formicarius]|uniref:axin-1 isoform X2 n=1 Tax=Cylas formicarius TaxID=197179 RepID=UPI00295854C0|nr:axin-1 isoform X2 [Cylas formicarius]